VKTIIKIRTQSTKEKKAKIVKEIVHII